MRAAKGKMAVALNLDGVPRTGQRLSTGRVRYERTRQNREGSNNEMQTK